MYRFMFHAHVDFATTWGHLSASLFTNATPVDRCVW